VRAFTVIVPVPGNSLTRATDDLRRPVVQMMFFFSAMRSIVLWLKVKFPKIKL
jgi:hypothetical protein